MDIPIFSRIKDIHKSILGYPKNELWISKNELWISKNELGISIDRE